MEKQFVYRRALYIVGPNRNPAGRYFVEKSTKAGKSRRYFDADYIYDACDDEESEDFVGARQRIAGLFSR